MLYSIFIIVYNVLIKRDSEWFHPRRVALQGRYHGPGGIFCSYRTNQIDLASTEKTNLEFLPNVKSLEYIIIILTIILYIKNNNIFNLIVPIVAIPIILLKYVIVIIQNCYRNN